MRDHGRNLFLKYLIEGGSSVGNYLKIKRLRLSSELAPGAGSRSRAHRTHVLYSLCSNNHGARTETK
jgi:hypothetical protein